ncbi:MAG: redoxin domain-containing protein [Burkholderiales bacterium]|nr:redoxin domain-containing protein [Phycisphaerae bacterium]
MFASTFRKLGALALCLGLASVLIAADKEVAIGSAAPAFTLKDQTGKDVSLSDFAGKIVVLEWFNEQCPIVVGHYKDEKMNKVASTYTDKGVVWLAINSSNFATPKTNEAAATAWKMSRPILDDSKGEIGHAYAATNTPHMYIIGKDGKLAYRGAIDSKENPSANEGGKTVNYVAKRWMKSSPASLSAPLKARPMAAR